MTPTTELLYQGILILVGLALLVGIGLMLSRIPMAQLVTLAGYKTYLISAAGVVLTAGYSVGWLSDAQFAIANGLWMALGLGTLRAGVAKTTKAAVVAATAAEEAASVAATVLIKPLVTPLRVESSPAAAPKDSS